MSLALDQAERILQEKLDQLRGECEHKQREASTIQKQVDALNERVETLHQEIEDKQQALTRLGDQIANGEQALAENKARTLKALDDREQEANARVEAAEAAKQAVLEAQQVLGNMKAAVQGSKADVLRALKTIEASAQALSALVTDALKDV